MDDLPDLFANNRHWAKKIKEDHPGFFEELSKEQNPEYLWIGCSDSRIPASEVVELVPGDLFVHRNIGNLVVHSDLNCQSVLQYAVEVLKVKHIIICGHHGCGGIRASMQDHNFGLIDNWLLHIKDVYKTFEDELIKINDEEEKINKLCERNVYIQVRNTGQNPFVQRAWKEGHPLTIHGWIYSLQNGIIKDLGLSISSNEEAEKLF